MNLFGQYIHSTDARFLTEKMALFCIFLIKNSPYFYYFLFLRNNEKILHLMYAWLIDREESSFRSRIREAPEKSPFWGSFALKMKIPGAETFGLPIISSFRPYGAYGLKYTVCGTEIEKNPKICFYQKIHNFYPIITKLCQNKVRVPYFGKVS